MSGVRADAQGAVVSDEGWSVSVLDPEWIEYRHGAVACLMNVAYSQEQRATQIFASDAASSLVPRLREHLMQAAPLLRGRYLVR